MVAALESKVAGLGPRRGALFSAAAKRSEMFFHPVESGKWSSLSALGTILGIWMVLAGSMGISAR